MESVRRLVARDDSDDSSSFSLSMMDLVITLFVLVTIGLGLVGALYFLRRRRQARKDTLLPTHSKSSNHRRLTVTATPYSGSSRTQSIYVYNEKREFFENSDSPPSSPVPEIRITFPDEEDKEGKRMSGKVVVVRIGETGSIGMEPVGEDGLPPYQAADAERFQSLDLERMGGLKEKEPKQWS
ncbi:hypothetical protein UCRPC4_g00548 [Phaeomoniella chlamydospora]|uniref:Uncharacterized protein n=1 Tax=Phaeomoniella chlamydospora TaxID=158046 RepID=A0A0G2F2N0_PHACM|nr:hypothetical protein UCRPC4_g00548 [Phaeomoniella chlamydospora]